MEVIIYFSMIAVATVFLLVCISVDSYNNRSRGGRIGRRYRMQQRRRMLLINAMYRR